VLAVGGRVDVIILPKVTSPDHVVWLDLLLGQVERQVGPAPER
jgi:citrate lyase subunit beta / citryl-CoA lyase